jgi:hypothetical protein
MGLSRLDNFLKSVRGTILYVDPNSIDATDSIENQGNSLTAPFKTIQRALAEAARFSYQRGLDNDRFNKTTIVLYPGDHFVDNRPGWIPDSSTNFIFRNSQSTNEYGSWDLTTNFDLSVPDNALYKLNSIHGGVIVPRGTSIVGMDLRKTRIRPKYVPNPQNDQIERSAIFRITGACYFWQFSILDAEPNDVCYIDYTTNQYVPNFSHHKLTAFEFVDGVNNVNINDDFITYSTDRTDLDMFYQKIGYAYGPSSGREIVVNLAASGGLDVQTKIDEYRIVGSRGKEVGITSIRAGDGILPNTTITVTLGDSAEEFDTDTPIRIEGVGTPGYDGQFVVSGKVDSTNIQYKVQNPPGDPAPVVLGATASVVVDTTTSASPYIFNISLRSVYGMCGLHADGDKVEGFKSMVVAQFTGIGLQKDNNAFVKYNSILGTYQDKTSDGNENIQSDSRARFKPTYENYHIKASNDAYIQVVSVFAIGYANHFVVENGGDASVTNSNSNFGARAFVASGFKRDAFSRDDVGYITHIIPPKENENTETSVEFLSIDVAKTVSVASTGRLYLYNQIDSSIIPESVIDGYRIGAKENDNLNVIVTQSGVSTTYSARIIMPNAGSEITAEKKSVVNRSSVGVNSITNSVLTLTSSHNLLNGESVRVISETGQLPDGVKNNTLYYAITSGTNIVSSSQIKLAQNSNDALSDNSIFINNRGGLLNIISRVSDKNSGDIGHPIQYDSVENQWYVNVSTAVTESGLYNAIISLGTTSLGNATSRSYITRKPDTRKLVDRIYRLRYVIPSDSPFDAKPPLDGYIIQESNTSIGSTTTEIASLYNPSLSTLANSTELRNPRYIAGANWSGGVANILTEIPHGLNVGSQIQILNVKSSNNPAGVANSSYNGTFTITGISSAKEFSYSLPGITDPGNFTNDTSTRNSSLPYFKKKKTSGTYYVYKTEEVQEYIPGQQDGIYYLTVLNANNSPSVLPFNSLRFSQPIQNLYPQINRDNPKSDPKESISFALPDSLGKVVVDDPQNSITKETLTTQLIDSGVGIGLTQLISDSSGTTHTIYTEIDHGYNRITGLTISNAGSNYVDGNYYNAKLVGFAGSITGSYATVRVTVNSGSISSVKIIDGGSAYEIGNTLAIVGIATTTSNVPGNLRVRSIYNNVGDVLSIERITPNAYSSYDSLYRITGVNGPKEITVASASSISPAYTSGIGITVASTADIILTGKSLSVYQLQYNNTTGIATIITSEAHGLSLDKKIRLGGADSNFFNGEFLIKSVGATTSFTINPGVTTSSVITSGNIFVHPLAYSSFGGDISRFSDGSSGRLIPQYAGITTTISSAIGAVDTTISISNVGNFDFNIGDYLLVDNEIMRIRSTVSVNPVSVFRGLLGTTQTSHSSGRVVRRIKPRPIELRRNSLIRGSAHTLEYLGFGPGNYSTAFPERQDRSLEPTEQLIAQATKIDGGSIVYTAMNENGDFITGNKKIISSSGKEELIDAPIPSIVGEDPGTGGVRSGFDIISPSEVYVERSIKVDGGPNNNLVSEFGGPVVFNNKITSSSPKGIEANSLYLQGDTSVSRKYSVGISTPTLASNPGDVFYNAIPATQQYVGWVYTVGNQWEKFGYIGEIGDKVGVSSAGNFLGIATMIDFRSGIGATIRSDFNSLSGIGTFIFDSTALNVGVSTGVGATRTFVGVASEINFIGYGVTISAVYNAGIASVTIDGSSLGGGSAPGLPLNSVQYNDGGFFRGNSAFTFDGSNVLVNNSIGISSISPTAKLEIVARTQEALRIKSTSGFGNILRIDNFLGDTNPFIVDINGRVGINTVSAIAPLDVVGNVAVTGQLRFYDDETRTNYVALQIPDISSDAIFTLPATFGNPNQVLYTTGSGVLTWINPSSLVALGITSTDALSEGTTNQYFTNERAQDAIGEAINAGIQTGITVSYDDATNKINFNVGNPTPYPFTTRGFSIPI